MNGAPQGGPTKAPTYLGDDLAGLHGALGAMAALRHRDCTGEGQHVDVALVDCLALNIRSWRWTMIQIRINLNTGQTMKVMSLSEAKMKLSALIEAINVSDEEVVITKNGTPAAVLVSPSEFESWRETVAIKSDADLMDEIKKGLRRLEGSKVRLYSLDELVGE